MTGIPTVHGYGHMLDLRIVMSLAEKNKLSEEEKKRRKRIYAKEHYLKNKKKIQEYRSLFKELNYERVREQQREGARRYRTKHPDRSKESKDRYFKRNYLAIRMYRQMVRLAKKDGVWT